MSGRHVVFVTTELEPLTPGGAGALVARLAAGLRAAGDRVTVVLAGPRTEGGAGVVLAGDGTVDDAAPTPFMARSRAAAAALTALVAEAGADLVEFQDFDGLAFWALARRHDLGLERTPLTVRLHGPVDLMVEAIGHSNPVLDGAAAMEREAFAMADRVVVPSPPFVAVAADRYLGGDRSRVAVGEPAIPQVDHAGWEPAPGLEFACYGRLAEVKGSHDFVAAAVAALDAGLDARFRLVGPDGWSLSADRPMSEWLTGLLPPEWRDRVELTGGLDRAQAAGMLRTARAVVVPSRFESFGLAAHEVRAMGLPLVVPDLPAFRHYWSEATGALVYDGSVAGLTAAFHRLAADPGLAARLAAAPLPGYADPLAPYADLPAPRHPQAQAGLGTAAVQRVEAALAGPGRTSAAARAARAALRVLPEPAARLAVRVLPRSLKDRVRALASWPAEAERRTRAERLAALRRRAAAGEFPELAAPEITVVVPCYDQAAYLDDAIASVFAQTLPSFEIVVVDDGSTDPAAVAAIDALRWPRTRVLRQPNRGLPAARNAGIAAARGRFVVPLDADDELAPTFLAELHDAISNRPDAAYAHCWAEMFGDVASIWATRPFNEYQMLLANSVVGCVLLRRSDWESVGGYDESMTSGNEDWELWLRLLAAGRGQVQVRAPLFRYRRHGVTMSVGTEARFEEERADLARRHPALYAAPALRRRKAQHYPWVSALVATPAAVESLAHQDHDDLEIVAAPAAEEAAAGLAARRGWPVRGGGPQGKLVVDWDAVTAAAPHALRSMAHALEEAPGAAAAGPVGGPAVLWRRWAIADADAEVAGTCDVDVFVQARVGRLGPGSHPDPDLEVSRAPGWPEVPIRRQPPEVEGPVPNWIEAGG